MQIWENWNDPNSIKLRATTSIIRGEIRMRATPIISLLHLQHCMHSLGIFRCRIRVNLCIVHWGLDGIYYRKLWLFNCRLLLICRSFWIKRLNWRRIHWLNLLDAIRVGEVGCFVHLYCSRHQLWKSFCQGRNSHSISSQMYLYGICLKNSFLSSNCMRLSLLSSFIVQKSRILEDWRVIYLQYTICGQCAAI